MVWFVPLHFYYLLGITTQGSCFFLSFGPEEYTWNRPEPNQQQGAKANKNHHLKGELPRQGQLVDQLNCSSKSITVFIVPHHWVWEWSVLLHQELTNTMVSSSGTLIIYSGSLWHSHPRDCLETYQGRIWQKLPIMSRQEEPGQSWTRMRMYEMPMCRMDRTQRLVGLSHPDGILLESTVCQGHLSGSVG